MYPILFKIGPIAVHSYGLFVALGFFTAGFFILRNSQDYAIPNENAWDLLFYILVFGIIGARLLHVVLNLSYYSKMPLEILFLQKGGLAIHGAIFFAAAASILYLVKKKLPVWKAGDLLMLYLPLGQAIGRIGCFLNGCCYGKVIYNGVRHPTQLYLSFAFFLIFGLLKKISRRRRFEGEIMLAYLLLFSTARFIIDFFRGDLSRPVFGLTISQLIGMAIFAIALLIFRHRWKNSF